MGAERCFWVRLPWIRVSHKLKASRPGPLVDAHVHTAAYTTQEPPGGGACSRFRENPTVAPQDHLSFCG